eukprot:PhF_6_TR13946/c0_g1_i3/m.22440
MDVSMLVTSSCEDEDRIRGFVHLAAGCGNVETLRSLLRINPRYSRLQSEDDGYCALHVAASSGHVECVRTLLSFDPTLTKLVTCACGDRCPSNDVNTSLRRAPEIADYYRRV